MTEKPDQSQPTPEQAQEQLEQALFEIRRIIAGQDAMLERVLVCLLAQGHLLIEGVPGPREDADDQDHGRRARRVVRARPVHSRPRAVGPRRNADLPTAGGHVRHRARPRLLQLPPRRRDQPRAREGAVGAARGHAGAPGDDRARHASRAVAVPRHGDPEPDRVRGDVSAPRGADRPLPAEGAHRLPAARRGAHGRPAPARRPSGAEAGAFARGSRGAPARGPEPSTSTRRS